MGLNAYLIRSDDPLSEAECRKITMSNSLPPEIIVDWRSRQDFDDWWMQRLPSLSQNNCAAVTAIDLQAALMWLARQESKAVRRQQYARAARYVEMRPPIYYALDDLLHDNCSITYFRCA
jgi:hypothetical protein